MPQSFVVTTGYCKISFCMKPAKTHKLLQIRKQVVITRLLSISGSVRTACSVPVVVTSLEEIVITLLQDDNKLLQTCQQLGTSGSNATCLPAVRFLRVKPTYFYLKCSFYAMNAALSSPILSRELCSWGQVMPSPFGGWEDGMTMDHNPLRRGQWVEM